MRSPRTATKSSACSPQLEKAHVQQWRPNAAKKRKAVENNKAGKRAQESKWMGKEEHLTKDWKMSGSKPCRSLWDTHSRHRHIQQPNKGPEPGWCNWGTVGKPVQQGPCGNRIVENKEAIERTEKERAPEHVGSYRSLWRLQLVLGMRWKATEELWYHLKIHFKRISLTNLWLPGGRWGRDS